MPISIKLILSMLLCFMLNPSFADVMHGNGYSYIVTGKVSKLDTDKDYIKKFTKAYGKKLEAFADRKLAPKISKLEGKSVAYLLRDPGKPRGERAARRTTSLAAFNQEVPQDVKDLAIAEFGATPEAFKAFPMGFKFKVSERSGKKFAARFYLYRKDKKRNGSLETIDLGEGKMLEMPKGVFKFKTKAKPKVKGVHYTLWGPGEVKTMTAELVQSLKDAGFETQVKDDTDNIAITFNKGEVDGRIGLVQTTTKDPSVNLVMLVKSAKCKLRMGEVSVWADNLISKCN